MSAVVFAYHDVGCTGLRVLHRLKIPVALVYTHSDDPTENTWFGSVRKTCEELKFPTSVADPNSEAEREKIAKLNPTAFFSFYYRDLLKKALLALPKRGGVNLHGSLLPKYRGRAPVNWQLLHGEKESAATLHYMVSRADAGDVVDQEPFAIGDDDTPTDVFKKLLVAAERVLERSAKSVMDGTAPRIVQMESKATTFGRRTPADGMIDWRMAAHDVRNLIRAVTEPYPGAFTSVGERKLLIWWADHEFADAAAPRAATAKQGAATGSSSQRPIVAPGTVQRSGADVFVVCGDRRRLKLVKFEFEKAGASDSHGHAKNATAATSSSSPDPRDVLRDGVVLGATNAANQVQTQRA